MSEIKVAVSHVIRISDLVFVWRDNNDIQLRYTPSCTCDHPDTPYEIRKQLNDHFDKKLQFGMYHEGNQLIVLNELTIDQLRDFGYKVINER